MTDASTAEPLAASADLIRPVIVICDAIQAAARTGTPVPPGQNVPAGIYRRKSAPHNQHPAGVEYLVKLPPEPLLIALAGFAFVFAVRSVFNIRGEKPVSRGFGTRSVIASIE